MISVVCGGERALEVAVRKRAAHMQLFDLAKIDVRDPNRGAVRASSHRGSATR